MSNIIVIGDLHTRYKEPFILSLIKILDHIVDSEHNTEDNIFILLGDLTENSINRGDINDILLTFFKNIKGQCIVIQGNHDYSKEHGSNIDILKSLDHVRLLYKPESLILNNLSFLALPYFYPNTIENYTTHQELYSNLPESLNKEHDFIIGHIEDETMRRSNKQKLCELDYLKPKYEKLFGHIHTFDKDTGGNYLGSIQPNSATEVDKRPHIAIIEESGKVFYKPLPLYINYYTVDYPEPLPEVNVDFPIFYIRESINKEETHEYYRKQAIERGFELYIRRTDRKKLSIDGESSVVEENLSDKEYFEAYSKINNLDSSVYNIITPILNKVVV